ncbi:hypothetical protein Ct9H90mP29_18020 [bacterium]|nr:MAG: hypothetical protein Ct9H90mP29_18020 [bacterium]
MLVPWAKAGVGAVATQSFVKVEYGLMVTSYGEWKNSSGSIK